MFRGIPEVRHLDRKAETRRSLGGGRPNVLSRPSVISRVMPAETGADSKESGVDSVNITACTLNSIGRIEGFNRSRSRRWSLSKEFVASSRVTFFLIANVAQTVYEMTTIYLCNRARMEAHTHAYLILVKSKTGSRVWPRSAENISMDPSVPRASLVAIRPAGKDADETRSQLIFGSNMHKSQASTNAHDRKRMCRPIMPSDL